MAENAFSKLAKEAEVLDYALGQIDNIELKEKIKQQFDGMSDEDK
jgi:hypothetical protein